MTTNPLLDHLFSRRSAKPDMMGEPGPNREELHQILTIAARVPDHKKLNPWRFIVLQGAGRRQAGEVCAAALLEEEAETPSKLRLDYERARFERAPVVVAVISTAAERRGVPEWEQVLSAGAAAFNLCHAANALGYATSWLTEWPAYSAAVRTGLKLAAHERIAGFIYIGTVGERLSDRERPDLESIVTHWDGSA